MTEFLAIMGIGTVVAIWIVANLPKSRGHRRDTISFEQKPFQTPAWRKDISEVYSTDGFDYLRKLERHQNDPQHWPYPFPPPEQRKVECEYD
jgi:hypothetical protein